MFDLSKLPDGVKLEVSKEALLAFAEKLRSQESSDEGTSKVQKEILSIEECGSLLNLARQTIYGLCSRRGIPFYKRNKRLYFKRSELLAWIEEGRKKTQVEFDEDLANFISKKQKKRD